MRTRDSKPLKNAGQADATISFDFDGQLHVHIDVRRREEVTLLESVLPALGCGLFHSLNRRATPHHPFFHRISALVASYARRGSGVSWSPTASRAGCADN